MENPPTSNAEGNLQDTEVEISSSITAGVVLGGDQQSTGDVEGGEVDDHEVHVGESNETSEGGNDETSQAAAGVEDLDYIQAFQRSRNSLPHWRNVLSPSRVEWSGSILLLSFCHGDGVVTRQCLNSPDFDRLHATSTDGAAPSDMPQAVFVRDISTSMMNSLGPAFDLSPEIFESQLVQSGFTPSSYEDPDPSTWLTRFLPKRHITLRWFSAVLRKDMEPRDMASRRLLISRGLKWIRYINGPGRNNQSFSRQQLHPAVNIFRQEWLVSARNRPPKHALVPDKNFPYSSAALAEILDTGEAVDSDRRFLAQSSLSENSNIVAWEERVTFCWGQRGQERRPILLFDPLPLMSRREPTGAADEKHVLPFSTRLAPRRPPPPALDGTTASLAGVISYTDSIKDACSDAAAWLDCLSRDSALEGCTPLDLQLLAAFHMVRQDTIAFLEHIDRLLDEISTGSMDERTVQDQLGHWRSLLGRFQRELPALDKSIHEFFTFPYEADDGEPPRELAFPLAKLRAKINGTADTCKTLQQLLRAEISLLESKRGIEEAESVSRLTELAFVFIPVTFAASLFSMQVQEFAESPPPVYAFIITAVVTVTVSYGLRVVQRSTLMTDWMRTTAYQIRTDKQITTKDIPIRKIISWGVDKLIGRPVIVAATCGSFALILTPLWARAAMDMSFKAAITGLTVLPILLTLLALYWVNSTRIPGTTIGGNNTLGFGRVWQRPAPTLSLPGSVESEVV